MTTRKSGLLGLILGMAVLAACEPKSVVELPPPDTIPTIALNLVPDTLTLNPGQAGQLVAVVTGTTTQTVTCTASNSVVTVSGGANGVCTVTAGTAAGTSVVTAVSSADARARDASIVRVATGTVPGTGNPTISIRSITTGNTLTPVNTQNVQGQIDVTVNADIPAGSNVQRIEVLVDNTVACQQTFSTSGEISIDGAQVPVEIICSINTAAFNATTGAPTFPNGTHRISARLVTAGGQISAQVAQDLVFNNTSFIVATPTFSKTCVTSTTSPGPGNLAPAGSLWCGGDMTVALLGVNFAGTTGAIATYNVAVNTSGLGSNGLTEAACSGVAGGAGDTNLGDAFPTCAPVTITRPASTGAAVVFAGGSLPTNSASAGTINTDIAGIEDLITITVTSVTTGGQAGPVCVNPVPTSNPLNVCGTGVGGSAPNTAFFVNPIRLDNLAPRVTSLNITPAALGCAPQTACFVNGTFSFTERTSGSGFFTTVDYGVDGQTAAFSAGAPGGTFTTVAGAAGTQLAETQVPSNALQAVTTDRLSNPRTVFATDVNTCFASTSSLTTANLSGTGCAGVTRIQLFGVDLTAPTLAIAAGPPNNSANAGNVYTISFTDAGVGPSGFSANPVRVKVEQITATGTVCLHPDTGATVSCTTNSGFVNDDGNITLPATNAYYRVTAFVVDEAGNSSAQITTLTLIDTAPPTTGGVVAPSTLVGGQSATFSASVQDNVDLGDVQAAIGYGVATLGYPRTLIGDGYGVANITTSTNASVTVPLFIRGIEPTLAGGRPNGAPLPAATAQFDVRDAAGVVNNVACPPAGQNCASSPAQNITPNVTAGGAPVSFTTSNPTVFASANPAHGNFLLAAPSNLTVCNGTTQAAPAPTPQPCPTNPTTTTLTATVTGQSGTTANPFSRVVFYYVDANGRAQEIGTGAVSVTDNTVTSTRTFTYTLVWTPTNVPAGATNVFALGVNANGDALMSNTQVVTITID